jgi:hypothetical protein
MLTKRQLARFREDGFLVLSGLFDPVEAAKWSSECKQMLSAGIADEFNLRTHPHYVTPGVWIVDRIEPVVDISSVFKELSRSELILNPLREILGGEVRLFKDKLVYRMVGTPGYNTHQDYSWWEEFPDDLVNVMIAVDGADADNGALEFFPGHHNRLFTPPGAMRNLNRSESNEININSGTIIKTMPGDVVFFHCKLPHRSGPNVSSRLRRQLYFTYSAARHGDFYERQLRLLRENRPSKGPNAENRDRYYFR